MSLSFALPLDSPRAINSGCNLALCSSPVFQLPRPFTSLSRTFSACVPRNRCLGFMQARLSHLCRQLSPSGIFPKLIVHNTRLARTGFPFRAILPYPALFLQAIQTQHCPSSVLWGGIGPFLSTFDQK